MNTDPSHDEAIDKVLAALRNASPPEGMEDRIAARIAREVASPQPVRSRFLALAPSSAWWRGAITGAAAAMLIVFAILLAQRESRSTTWHSKGSTAESGAAQIVAPGSKPPSIVAVSESRSRNCPNPAVQPVQVEATTSHARLLRYATLAPSHPAPAEPLTPQERALLQLARTGDPNQLTTVNPDTLAKTQDQEAADFNKFFNPPPDPLSSNE
jgi:hypothetical protein